MRVAVPLLTPPDGWLEMGECPGLLVSLHSCAGGWATSLTWSCLPWCCSHAKVLVKEEVSGTIPSPPQPHGWIDGLRGQQNVPAEGGGQQVLVLWT